MTNTQTEQKNGKENQQKEIHEDKLSKEYADAFKQVSDVVWELPASFKKGMQVPARLIATKELLQHIDNNVIEQLTNVACLPGIVRHAYCMADAHSGYGFPIGGVAAFDPEQGIISPGGIGFDINCGMRLVKTNLFLKDVEPVIKPLVDLLFKKVPAGVGGKGFVQLNNNQFTEVMSSGADWCIEQGYGWKADKEQMEENGCITSANPDSVSEKARARGISQLGTLGSGNHYLEIQVADKLFDEKTARLLGIQEGQIMVMVHCGSRGFGHQIGSDYLQLFEGCMRKYKITIPDRELACAPFKSNEGQKYFGAMACAANMAFANRQVILHRIRECFSHVFMKSAEELEMELIYDVCHNIAKIEEHIVDGRKKELVVHRKGATRSFGPSRMTGLFAKTGQPVIIGGSMETGSYLLAGTDESESTWCSTAHGSGRTMSRTQAKRMANGQELQQKMQARGIYVRTASYAGLAEEAGFAYKDISEVVHAMQLAGVSKPVVALRPIGNIKG